MRRVFTVYTGVYYDDIFISEMAEPLLTAIAGCDEESLELSTLVMAYEAEADLYRN